MVETSQLVSIFILTDTHFIITWNCIDIPTYVIKEVSEQGQTLLFFVCFVRSLIEFFSFFLKFSVWYHRPYVEI